MFNIVLPYFLPFCWLTTNSCFWASLIRLPYDGNKTRCLSLVEGFYSHLYSSRIGVKSHFEATFGREWALVVAFLFYNFGGRFVACFPAPLFTIHYIMYIILYSTYHTVWSKYTRSLQRKFNFSYHFRDSPMLFSTTAFVIIRTCLHGSLTTGLNYFWFWLVFDELLEF